MSGDISWWLTGGYYGITEAIESHKYKNGLNESYYQVKALFNENLEREARELIYMADEHREKFYEIWESIEAYKRANPHEIMYHIFSFWNDVGTVRYPFTIYQYFVSTKKTSLNKSDYELINMYRYRTMTLLMNMRGGYGRYEACRKIGCARKENIAWTYQYG